MKLTDRYFRFPIKVYDGWELTKAMIKEEKQLESDPEEAQLELPSWVQCWQRVRPSEILGWSENFSRESNFEEVASKGGDMTMVETKHLGMLPCLWTIREFEDRLNIFYDKSKQVSTNSIKTSRFTRMVFFIKRIPHNFVSWLSDKN